MKTQNNQMETKTPNNNANRTVLATDNNTKNARTTNLRTNNKNNNQNQTNHNNITYVNVNLNKTSNNLADDRKLNIEMKTQNNYNPTGVRQTEKWNNQNKNYYSVKNENQELISRLQEEIFGSSSDQTMVANNKYTYNIQNNVKMDDLVKEINDENMTKEKKKALYFRLKAEKYNDELEYCTKIPSKFSDFLDISETAKNKHLLLKNRLKFIDIVLCFTSLIAIYVAFADNNIIVTSYNLLFDKYIVNRINDNLRYLNMLLNLISLILIFCRYNLILNMKKLNKGTISNFDSIASAGYLGQLLVELFINLILIPPKTSTFFEMGGSIYVSYNYSNLIRTPSKSINIESFKQDNISYQYLQSRGKTTLEDYFYIEKTSVKLQYNISTIILFFMSFRIYHFFRLVHTFSSWNTPKASIVCKNLNCDANVSFGIRAILKKYPSLSLMFGMLFIIVFFGTGLSIFEYYNQAQMSCLGTLSSSTNASQAQVMLYFSNIYNSFWLVVVTMTTIGYGDIYPTTFLGRLLAIAACISGTFLLSLIIVFLNNFIYFDDIEKKIYEKVIEESDNPLNLKKQSAELIKRILAYHHLRKVDPEGSDFLRMNLRMDIKFWLNEFRLVLFKSRNREFDLDGEIENINFNINNGIIPIKKRLEEFNENSKAFEKAAQINFFSLSLSEKFKKNSIQMYNLLRVLNKNEPLENLQSIDEVYENQADMVEEIIFFNKIKKRNSKSNKKIIFNNTDNVSVIKSNNNDAATVNNNNKPQFMLNNQETEEDEEEEFIDHLDYINNLKKSALI